MRSSTQTSDFTYHINNGPLHRRDLCLAQPRCRSYSCCFDFGNHGYYQYVPRQIDASINSELHLAQTFTYSRPSKQASQKCSFRGRKSHRVPQNSPRKTRHPYARCYHVGYTGLLSRCCLVQFVPPTRMVH